MAAVLTQAIIFVLLFFVVVRFILEIVFKRLTAHWIAIGLSTSYLLGLLIFELLASHKIFIAAFHSGQPIYYDFILSWLVALIPLNFLVLPGLYWWDKRVAVKNNDKANRVPENALHALTFSGGLLGAYIGQKAFQHKVSKQSFQTKHYVVCGLSIIVYIYIGYSFLVK